MITLAQLIAHASAEELNMPLFVEVDGMRAPLLNLTVERTSDAKAQAVIVLVGK